MGELATALGIPVPVKALDLHMDVDSVVTATVTFYPERDRCDAAADAIAKYRLAVVGEAEDPPGTRHEPGRSGCVVKVPPGR